MYSWVCSLVRTQAAKRKYHSCIDYSESSKCIWPNKTFIFESPAEQCTTFGHKKHFNCDYFSMNGDLECSPIRRKKNIMLINYKINMSCSGMPGSRFKVQGTQDSSFKITLSLQQDARLKVQGNREP